MHTSARILLPPVPHKFCHIAVLAFNMEMVPDAAGKVLLEKFDPWPHTRHSIIQTSR